MNSIIRIVFILYHFVILFLLVSCGAGVNNASEELSNDTFFRESGSDLNHIESHNHLHKTIYSKIVDYDYNQDFILVCQEPIRKYHTLLLGSELNDGSKHIDYFIEKADSILTNDPYYIKVLSSKRNFWIIVNKSHELVGPMTYREYLKKRDHFGIPKSIRLDIEE
jgi:hypothetical protein